MENGYGRILPIYYILPLTSFTCYPHFIIITVIRRFPRNAFEYDKDATTPVQMWDTAFPLNGGGKERMGHDGGGRKLQNQC